METISQTFLSILKQIPYKSVCGLRTFIDPGHQYSRFITLKIRAIWLGARWVSGWGIISSATLGDSLVSEIIVKGQCFGDRGKL